MFRVAYDNDDLLFIGPIDSVARILNLADAAVERIHRETANGGRCEMFFNRPLQPWPNLKLAVITFEPS